MIDGFHGHKNVDFQSFYSSSTTSKRAQSNNQGIFDNLRSKIINNANFNYIQQNLKENSIKTSLSQISTTQKEKTHCYTLSQSNKSSSNTVDQNQQSLLIDYSDNLELIDCNLYLQQCNNTNANVNPQPIVSRLIADIKNYSQDEGSSVAQSHTYESYGANQNFQICEFDKRKRKYGPNRKYISKRIYLCGACASAFNFVEELLLHIKKQHGDQIPDGTIFGFKKQILFKFFHIPFIKPPAMTQKKVYLFKCGCGKEYNCSSSLLYHIKVVHGGIEPAGTIGVLRSVRIQ